MQSGLVPAVYFTVVMNGLRLGLYATFEDGIRTLFGGKSSRGCRICVFNNVVAPDTDNLINLYLSRVCMPWSDPSISVTVITKALAGGLGGVIGGFFGSPFYLVR